MGLWFDRDQKRLIALSGLSSGLEYYDFMMFVLFAKAISATFFVETSTWVSLMATFGVFAVGYLARPLGAIVFGHWGDRRGRKSSFVSTALVMALASLGIAVLPGAHAWGLASPVLLVLLRILQGFSLGGEFAGSIVYTVEVAPTQHRALACGFLFAGVNIGMILAYGVSAAITHHFQPAGLVQWGWRIAFLVGGALGVVNFYLRRALSETSAFMSLRQQERPVFPLLTLIRQYPKALLQGVFIVMIGGVANAILMYLPTYFLLYHHLAMTKLLLISAFNLALITVEQLMVGFCSDRYGRKKVFMVAMVIYCLVSYPLFLWLATGDLKHAIVLLIIFGLLNGLASNTYPALLAELFPTSIRYSGFAISYGIAFALFAGLTPMALTYGIHVTGWLTFPGIYLSSAGLIAVLVGLTLANKSRY